MGFRRHKGRGLFDCGSLSRTRLDIRAGVRPRFNLQWLENSMRRMAGLPPGAHGAFFARVNGNRNRPGFTETRLRG
jgi:hypothetical protein